MYKDSSGQRTSKAVFVHPVALHCAPVSIHQRELEGCSSGNGDRFEQVVYRGHNSSSTYFDTFRSINLWYYMNVEPVWNILLYHHG